jgi:hypothetical protein
MIEENKISKIKNKKYGIKLFLLGIFTSISGLFRLKTTPNDLKKMEFSSSSQRLGISFTDKIRNAFRYKWIKKAGQK